MHESLRCGRRATAVFIIVLVLAPTVYALAPGYTKTTVLTNAPPSALTYAPDGTLYALEAPPFGSQSAVIRVIQPDLTFGTDISIAGSDPTNLFIGGMTWDSVGGRLLITDNAAAGDLIALTPSGTQSVVATGITAVAGVAVRTTGEIFVSTAAGNGAGQVLQVDRATGATAPVMGGLDFGAGLAFDPSGHLVVQESDGATFRGALYRIPIDDSGASLEFGAPVALLTGMQSAAGLAVDSEGEVYTTGGDFFGPGPGGLFLVTGNPPVETNIDHNGSGDQFSTAITFLPGTGPFTAGTPDAGGRLAYLADFGTSPDSFVTIVSTTVPEPTTVLILILGFVGWLAGPSRWCKKSKVRHP